MDQAIGILGQVILVLVGFACVLGLVLGVLVEIQAIARIMRKLKEHAVIPDPYAVQSTNGKADDPRRGVLGS